MFVPSTAALSADELQPSTLTFVPPAQLSIQAALVRNAMQILQDKRQLQGLNTPDSVDRSLVRSGQSGNQKVLILGGPELIPM